MAQVDTRHEEKNSLMALLVAKYFPENIDLQIAQAKAKMEKSDIADVMAEFEELKRNHK
ncbi:MAG: hypothetical protein FWF94_06510 [Oscillospiraceae bacterium]|nr:hypothetical protein [Oscillospiraceae bacterium]